MNRLIALTAILAVIGAGKICVDMASDSSTDVRPIYGTLQAQKMPVAPKRKTYISPDGNLTAIIWPSGKFGHESRIQVQTSSGNQIFVKDFGSSDGEHGMALTQAQWTPDSKFFVWSSENSGGHSPWHYPTYFFSARKRAFFSVDSVTGAVTRPEFSVKAPNTVTGMRLNPKGSSDVPFSVKLSEHDSR